MFLRFYLIAYFALLAAAAIVLWQGEVLGRLPASWVVAVFGVAALLGLLLAFVSRPPVGS